MIQLGWEIVHISAMMAPYLLFGFLMAGLLSMFFTPETIRKHLGKPTWGSISKLRFSVFRCRFAPAV